MPSSEWPTPEAIDAGDERMENHRSEHRWDEGGRREKTIAVLTAAAKASPVIPATKCETCGGERATRGENGALHTSVCPDCHGTGVAEIIRTGDVAALREALRRIEQWPNFNSCCRFVGGIAGEALKAVDDPPVDAPVAEVIPVAVLREWIAFERESLPPPHDRTEVGAACARELDRFAALLDEHTRKEPTQV